MSRLADFVSKSLCVVAMLALWPTFAAAQTPNLQVKEALRLLENKEYSQALDILHSVESRIANPGDISSLLGLAYLGLGYQSLSANKFAEARENFIEGRRYNEADTRLWQGEAMTLYRQGQYAEAVMLLEQASGTVSPSAGLYLQLGQTYYADGRMQQAIDALMTARELGGGEDVDNLLEKVTREWQVERKMEHEVGGHFLLSFVDGPHTADLADAIVETLEDAYTELGSDLAFYPDVSIPVLLYSQQEFSILTRSPDWAGGLYDGKIRLPLGGLKHMSEPLAAVLYHEYAHVLVHFMANRNVPSWLNEGLAEMAGFRVNPQSLVHLQEAIASGRLIDWGALQGSFAKLSEQDVRLAYEQSFSLVRFMIENYGWHKIADLLEDLGRKQEWQAAIAEVYQDYGLDWPAINREWQASLGR